MGKTIAFHSYKGGTGKTSIAANVATLLARDGEKACVLDFDFRAPSLNVLFKSQPKKWLNDYLDGNCEIDATVVDLSAKYKLRGKLAACFANPSLAAMSEMMTKDRKWEMKALQRTLSGKKELLGKGRFDYLIFDTAPGAQYSSINALASADAVGLIMKADEFDLEGTREMSKGIYEALGRKSALVLNKIPLEQLAEEGGEQRFESKLEALFHMPVLGLIPCFCELMAMGGKFLFVLEKPEHTFSKSLFAIATRLREF
jgi:septum site-determining protein MinD